MQNHFPNSATLWPINRNERPGQQSRTQKTVHECLPFVHFRMRRLARSRCNFSHSIRRNRNPSILAMWWIRFIWTIRMSFEKVSIYLRAYKSALSLNCWFFLASSTDNKLPKRNKWKTINDPHNIFVTLIAFFPLRISPKNGPKK